MLKNRMDADDATQEVLIRIWENLDNFKFESAQTWIMRTAHNACIDQIRRRKFSFEKEQYFDEELIMNENENPKSYAEENNLRERISDALKILPENLRSVFILYEFQEMKYEEISKVLEIPLNSVKVYLLRARKKLQEELKEYAY